MRRPDTAVELHLTREESETLARIAELTRRTIEEVIREIMGLHPRPAHEHPARHHLHPIS
jgi:DNA-directed RNA polymerase specialized sigma54-like protein